MPIQVGRHGAYSYFTTSHAGVMQGIPVRTNPISLNPFSLMMEPELVLQAMERSKSLRSLRRHQLRPLDKPLIPYAVAPQDDDLGDADTLPAELHSH
jgi:hypothetical protein